MRIRVYSDLHKEFEIRPEYVFTAEVAQADADIVVLAGDTDLGIRGVEWANTFKVPVIYIMGNHEYYNHGYPKLIDKCKEAAAPHVHVLENEQISIGGVRFLGCTLWTNFEATGSSVVAMTAAQQSMNDYHEIRNTEHEYRKLWPQDTLLAHKRSVKWLKQALTAAKLSSAGEKVVVVTHHVPSLKSEPRRDLITAAYVSDLDALIEEFAPNVWVHGHNHMANSYLIGTTHIVANPRGYVGYAPVKEFKDFFTVVV